MKQEVDVLAVFDVGSRAPKPIRFKVRELGIKKTVRVTNINNIEWIRANGTTRAVYYCDTINAGQRICYNLHYFYNENRWEVET
jgi:hypothetical protein